MRPVAAPATANLHSMWLRRLPAVASGEWSGQHIHPRGRVRHPHFTAYTRATLQPCADSAGRGPWSPDAVPPAGDSSGPGAGGGQGGSDVRDDPKDRPKDSRVAGSRLDSPIFTDTLLQQKYREGSKQCLYQFKIHRNHGIGCKKGWGNGSRAERFVPSAWGFPLLSGAGKVRQRTPLAPTA